MSNYTIPVSYLDTTGKELWNTEDAWIPPVVGQGVVNEAGSRFRVVDVWVKYDKHSAMGEYGVYAFLAPAASEDDRLQKLYPYYSNSGS